MILGVALFAVAVIVAVWRRDQPQMSVAAYLTAWTLLPSSFVAYTGAAIPFVGLHPASWFIFASVFVQLLCRLNRFSSTIAKNPGLVILAVVVLAMWWITATGGRVPLLFDEIITPQLALLLVLLSPGDRSSAVRFIALVVIILGTLQALAGLAEFFAGRYLFYVEANTLAYAWYDPSRFDRPMGTTGHALVLGFVTAAPIPLLVQLRQTRIQLLTAAALFSGALVSQTRLSLVVAAIGVIYVLIRSRVGPMTRMLLVVAASGGALGVALFSGQLGTFSRFGFDDGSADLRRVAYGWFLENWPSLPVIGGGMGTYGAVAHSIGISTSFESSIVQLTVDFGIPLTASFIGGTIVLVAGVSGARRLRGSLAAAVLASALTLTFSSIGNQTLVGPILFTILALSVPQIPINHSSQNETASSARFRRAINSRTRAITKAERSIS